MKLQFPSSLGTGTDETRGLHRQGTHYCVLYEQVSVGHGQASGARRIFTLRNVAVDLDTDCRC